VDPTIEVVILPDGTVKIEGRGFSGADCEHATRALEAALGLTVDDQRTSEYWEADKQKVRA